ncbi:SusD/RagB family nutrient-binding outer membrane lipoprotein [Dinghuibacter silviterrae]|uniref:SusD-like starch-binding protein associating with outer membrane n=1 Tax=Dinghuibacter silviterrae TaxID=1539049 RepID=A0A4R8DT33_9BACT|nr:SusD/RagB family nutrient-binding outer membrane lipoprotein [Dinghuibacter silviterrae]TDX00311.1 SusD-like starch-binding protein associating with outer membrane [Dinghuibacter silviterrae]
MKRSFLYIAVLLLGACSRSKYASLNTNPDAVLSVAPEYELTTGQMANYTNDFEAFYDYYQYIRPWTQLWVSAGGNTGTGAFINVANGNQRWGIFYSRIGPPLVDVQHLIALLPAAKAAQYVYLNAITGITLAQAAFYCADPNGSMPFTQAFEARYTGNLTPVWDAQQALFDTLDARLKSYVTTLESTQSVTQNTGGNNDIIFQGNVNKWIMAANSLRLRIALRLMKQSPSQTTSIANDVLADKVGPIDNAADEWVFITGQNFEGGNFNPLGYSGNQCMEKNVVDFMNRTGDPRIRALLQPSGINTQDIFDSAQAQGQIPAGVTWDGLTYRGQYASPDQAKVGTQSYLFHTLTFSYQGNKMQVNYPSIINPYILYAPYNSGLGVNAMPVITYADVCFMRAELILRGLSNDNASPQALYNAGVAASITDFDAWAQKAVTPNYTPLGSSEIATYLTQTGVAYQASTALEQVLDQEYLNLYMNPNEAWALIKRTGYPSPTGAIMPLETLTSGGSPVVMPRRYVPQFPLLGDLNYNNAVSAINTELQQPGYGAANDITGKVWWDQ